MNSFNFELKLVQGITHKNKYDIHNTHKQKLISPVTKKLTLTKKISFMR